MGCDLDIWRHQKKGKRRCARSQITSPFPRKRSQSMAELCRDLFPTVGNPGEEYIRQTNSGDTSSRKKMKTRARDLSRFLNFLSLWKCLTVAPFTCFPLCATPPRRYLFFLMHDWCRGTEIVFSNPEMRSVPVTAIASGLGSWRL